MRKYAVIAVLSIVLIFLLTVFFLAIYVGSQSSEGDRQVEIESERLDDFPHIASRLSEWAGYQVHLPDPVSIPPDLELTRARVTEAFDPGSIDRLDGEWWAELRWDKPRHIGDHEGHPWFWAVFTQGRDIPVPEHAEPVQLLVTGAEGHVNHVIEDTHERLTIWVNSGGFVYTFSVESVEPIDIADLDSIIATILG